MTLIRSIDPGEGLQAGHINQFVRALAEVQRAQAALAGNGGRLDVTGSIMAWALNSTGADLGMGEVAAVSGSPYEGAALGVIQDGVSLTLRAAETLDDDKFVICDNYIPDGQLGRVYVSGVCLAQVAPQGSGEGGYAETADSETVLQEADSGPAVILSNLGEVGDGYNDWCLVRFPVTMASIEPPRWQDAP